MFLPKMWLRLEEAKDRLKTEKNINVSESDILHFAYSTQTGHSFHGKLDSLDVATRGF